DRILTIAQSNELVDYMVDSFRLYHAYDLDPDNSKAPHYVELNFQKLYNVTRTPFDAILLEIEYKDPALSARMVEAARGKINEIATGLIRSSQQNQILLFESNMRDQEAALAIIEDSLSNISRTYGIINSESQSEVLSTLITQARANLERSRAQLRSLSDQPGSYQDSLTLISSRIRGYEQELRSLIRGQVDGAANFRSFSDGISKFENLRTRHEQLSRNQSELVEKLSKLKNAYLSSVPAIHVIEHAKVPVIKSRPVRSLLVTSATIAAFIFSILGALVFDYYKKIDWNSIKRS
ncbi:MAG: hypothetical protein KJP00_14805, partial [Bacteroidia bacterium]|nr:hypothetical protein [Bacteroidia bacterium]